jgi:hypothetical protein
MAGNVGTVAELVSRENVSLFLRDAVVEAS